MMEEEKLRRQEEEGSVFDDEENIKEEEDECDEVIEKEADIPSVKKSPSHMSALSYELFVEQFKDVIDDNGDNNVEKLDTESNHLDEEEEEETRELVTSPGDNCSQRKVGENILFFIVEKKELTLA